MRVRARNLFVAMPISEMHLGMDFNVFVILTLQQIMIASTSATHNSILIYSNTSIFYIVVPSHLTHISSLRTQSTCPSCSFELVCKNSCTLSLHPSDDDAAKRILSRCLESVIRKERRCGDYSILGPRNYRNHPLQCIDRNA